MNKLVFVTGNKDKLAEAKSILSNFQIDSVVLDIPEFQGNRDVVVKEKARLAAKKLGMSCFVDDTSLCFNALKSLPGIYIKEFLEKLGREGLVKLLSGFEDKSAEAVCMIGFCAPGKDPVCFEGITEGNIVSPRGDKFGWDPIFQPFGYKKTFAEMSKEEKNKISHRKKALQKFKKFLDKEK